MTTAKHANQKVNQQGAIKKPSKFVKPQKPKEKSPHCFKWPVNFMKKETFKKGAVIFRAGDNADRMFYISKGAIKLIEINKILREGEVIGEMGIFSPLKERTVSAVCEEDLEAYTMGREEVINFFGQDPALGIDLIQTCIERFIENLKAETEARERIESELRIAHDIQASMLPNVFPQRKEFEIFAMMSPAKEVGGDFYDFFFIDQKRLCFVIGDVSGKGVPAALFMAITKTLIKTEAKRGLSTNEIVSRVNNILCPDNNACMFVTVFCVIMDIETGRMQYCNGGHNPPLIIKNNGEVSYIKVPSGFVVGAIEDTRCEKGNLALEPGDAIFLYTDGVTEAMNPQRQLFGEARLQKCLVKLKDCSMEKTLKTIRKKIASYAKEEPQSDDITMLALKYKGTGSE